MKIESHPIWKNISSYKKPAHLLRFWLARHLAALFPRSTFIGVTGSVGKTSTVRACEAVLSQKFKTLITRENLDPILNIPMTLLKLRPNTKKAILEMGIEYPGEMEFYLSLVHPASAIVTRIFFAHSQFLGGVEEIAREKVLLVRQLPKDGFAILNWDDIYTRKMSKETKAQVLFYGTNQKECHVWAGNIRLEEQRTRFELNYGVERADVTLKVLGRHFVYPVLAAASLGISLGMSLASIKKGLEKVEPTPHRLQLFEGLGGWLVLDDTYNASPAAVEEALNVLNDLPAGRRVVVLGEMRELGPHSELLHRAIAQKMYKDKIDFILLGGGDARFIADEMIKLGYPAERIEVNLSNSQLVAKVLRLAKGGDIVLVKGSRALKLDEVVKRITKQKY